MSTLDSGRRNGGGQLAGTVETAILDLQARKQALADGLYDPETSKGAKLTEADLAVLFAPLS